MLKIPQTLLDDAILPCEEYLFLARLGEKPASAVNSAELRATSFNELEEQCDDEDWGSLPRAVRFDLFVTCLDALSGADYEGLGDPWDEAAHSLAVFVAGAAIRAHTGAR